MNLGSIIPESVPIRMMTSRIIKFQEEKSRNLKLKIRSRKTATAVFHPTDTLCLFNHKNNLSPPELFSGNLYLQKNRGDLESHTMISQNLHQDFLIRARRLRIWLIETINTRQHLLDATLPLNQTRICIKTPKWDLQSRITTIAVTPHQVRSHNSANRKPKLSLCIKLRVEVLMTLLRRMMPWIRNSYLKRTSSLDRSQLWSIRHRYLPCTKVNFPSMLNPWRSLGRNQRKPRRATINQWFLAWLREQSKHLISITVATREYQDKDTKVSMICLRLHIC